MIDESGDEKTRVLEPKEIAADEQFDLTLRPKTLREYIGQEKNKEHLDIFLAAARKRKQPMEHLLVYGPPGLGKTTLAHVLANEMGCAIKVTSGPAIERAGDLASLLTNLQDFDVLFIDEIHRLPRIVEEVLYPAMEDFRFDIILGKGPGARSVRLDYYEEPEIASIIRRSGKILDIKIDDGGVGEVARRARRTPRIANRLL